MINLTTAAALKLETFITDKEVVRLAVEGGGCAGFQYRFGLVPIAETFEDDYIVEKLGVKLFVDAISYMYLENVEIDYEDTHFSSAFKINNPDVKATCGCGSSFS
jgi:iron-sulfur cluster assembly accessory protein